MGGRKKIEKFFQSHPSRAVRTKAGRVLRQCENEILINELGRGTLKQDELLELYRSAAVAYIKKSMKYYADESRRIIRSAGRELGYSRLRVEMNIHPIISELGAIGLGYGAGELILKAVEMLYS